MNTLKVLGKIQIVERINPERIDYTEVSYCKNCGGRIPYGEDNCERCSILARKLVGKSYNSIYIEQ